MQVKSARGVQQAEVWAAADALIAEGLRPTIERVRQKMGRGSPNTVSPMLEAWFATLAPRLGVAGAQDAKNADNEVPAPVVQAITKLWESAIALARQEAASKLEQAQNTVAQARLALDSEKEAHLQSAQLIEARETAALEALGVARSQTTATADRLAECQALLAQQTLAVDALRLSVADQAVKRDAERQASEAQAKHLADERRRQDERTSASEKNMLLELDRERQESKKAKSATADAVRRLESAQQSAKASQIDLSAKLQMMELELGSKLQEAELELRSTRQALAFATERSTELLALLESQRTETGHALAQFNQFLLDSAQAAASAAASAAAHAAALVTAKKHKRAAAKNTQPLLDKPLAQHT